MSDTLKKSKITLAICLVVIIIAGFVSMGVKSANGEYLVKEVTISPYGADLSFTMYIPAAAFDTDESGHFVKKYPAVIVNEGFTEDRSCMNNVAIELTRQGFVVALFDMYGHGRSESLDNKGYGNNPDPFSVNCSLLGADDVRDYLYTQGYVDAYNIGMVGHSLGGSATAAMLGEYAGRYTLQDELLIALHDEYGAEVSAADVEAQNADAVAERELSPEDLGAYNVRKAEISDEYNKAIRSGMILDASGIKFMKPDVVDVAGNEVWRDVQCNIALVLNISGGTTKGLNDKDYALTADLSLTMLGQSDSVERETWYATNLSGSSEKLESTKLAPFYSDISDSEIQQAANEGRLRVMTQPFGWHAFSYISDDTASAAAQFFATTLQYKNGSVTDGASGVARSTGSWKIQELASGLALFALVFMVFPLVDIIMEAKFFDTLKGTPTPAVQDKKNPLVWIWAVFVVVLPAATYTKGVGWGMNIPASPISTVAVATQTAVWALVMTAILAVLTVAKYFFYDKKKLNVSFKELYGLNISFVNICKSIVLAISVFAIVALILTLYYNLFGAAEMRATLLSAFVFGKMAKHQYYSWFIYVIWFLPFYLLNGMLIVSARMKNMSEKANTLAMAAINCSGTAILAFMQIIMGLMMNSSPLVKTIPGSSATIYNLPFLAFMMFASTIINRKIYKKTGSAVPGVLVNLMFFTIAAIRAYTYYAL